MRSCSGGQYINGFVPGFNQDENFYYDYTVVSSSLGDPWFAGTGIVAGDVFVKRVGYEWDQIVPGCRSDVTPLFRYDAGVADGTKYTAASGATVFSAGTFGFNYALDDWRLVGPAVSPADPRLQTFFRNMFVDTSSTATTQLTIRAAGATGEEQLQLQIDGIPVRTWDNVGGNYAQRVFQTFTYVYPGTLSADRVRVAFTNDGTSVAGADRNLHVDALTVAGVTYESEAPTTYSTGTWNDADGCGPGNKQDETLHCPGYFQYAQPSVGTSIDIRAAGQTGEEQMQLLVDGVTVKTWNNIGGNPNARVFQTLTYTHPTLITLDQVRVAFTNDGNTTSGADRNLVVDAILFGGQLFETEAATTYSTGTYDDATGCGPGNKLSETLHCGGYFQYAQPASGSVVDILAAGYTGEEQMQLLVDGVPVRTWDNVGGDYNQRQFILYTYTHPTALTASQLRVAFTNDGNTVSGADRNLGVDAITLDGTRYESEAPATYSTGTWSDATGCAPGNKLDEVIHCGGYFQYAGGPGNSPGPGQGLTRAGFGQVQEGHSTPGTVSVGASAGRHDNEQALPTAEADDVFAGWVPGWVPGMGTSDSLLSSRTGAGYRRSAFGQCRWLAA